MVGVVGEVTYLLLGMAHAIDLNNLSLDELHVLAGRIECRIRTLSASTDEQTATSAPADPWASPGGAGPGPFRSGMASGIHSETRPTLSEKVQDLIHTNDPCEGSGVVRTPESAACLPRAQRGPALLPAMLRQWWSTLQNLPYSCANYLGVCPALPARDMPSALRNLLFPVLFGWYHSWTTCV